MKRLIDYFRRNKIYTIARENGCDLDGDVVVYKGVKYYVDIIARVVRRIG